MNLGIRTLDLQHIRSNTEGRIYIRVDKDALKRLDNKKGFSLHINGLSTTILARCLRWGKLVKEMFEFGRGVRRRSGDRPSSEAEGAQGEPQPWPREETRPTSPSS